MAEQLINQQLANRLIHKDESVNELYLAHSNLKEVCSLSRFKHLNRLWMNYNKLRNIDCLLRNFRLSELYLDNNMLVDIKGALRHLDCLQVLTLHNNQLTNLTNVVDEFRKMLRLRQLSLFHNPVSHELGYRYFVIHSVPSLETLDHQMIQSNERITARQHHCQKEYHTRSKIAFQRSSLGPPNLTCPPVKLTITQPREFSGQNLSSLPVMSSQDVYIKRRLVAMTNVFTVLDWEGLPRRETRRLHTQLSPPQLVTHVFR